MLEQVSTKRFHLVSGETNLPLAEEIADQLGERLCETNLAEFANGELHCRFGESVRGSDVFILQSHCTNGEFSVNDAIMQQLIMVDAAAGHQQADHGVPFSATAARTAKPKAVSPSPPSSWPTSS